MAKDVQMIYLDNDIEKIQVKTNMYIVNYGEEGAFHLFREVFQNSIDELCDKNSNGKKIYVTYDKITEIITCEDDGRGFPEKDYPLDIFCTTLQSGSKFYREGGVSSGEFGVGLCVVNAVSDLFELTSYREDEMTAHTLKFVEGKKVFDEVKKLKSPKHGSLVKFKPSKKYLGKDAKFPYKKALDWIGKLMYFPIDNDKLKITFDVVKGLELIDRFDFKKKKFEDLIKEISPESTSPLVILSMDDSIVENIKYSYKDKDGKNHLTDKEVKKDIHMDVALAYDISGGPSYTDSYCNYTNTTEGGIHVEAVDRAFCGFMQAMTKQTMTDNQKEKTPIIWDDVRSGLYLIVNLSTSAAVEFAGNQKQKVGSLILAPILLKMCNKEINKYFKDHPNILENFIKIVKLNAKTRIEVQKTKSATQTERLNNLKEWMMDNYIPCNNTGKAYKELYIVEGQSASGSVRDACDTNTQAELLLRGVIPNAYKYTLSEIMQNKELNALVTVMRCGIGKTFDINKLYFNRINIFTDEDSDGFYISALILAFFYKFMPEIIEAGKLYKVFTPLYKIDNKDKPYVANKQEMIDIYQEKLSKNFKIKFNKNDDWLSKKEFKEFLSDTYTYRNDLNMASDLLGKVNKYLVEAAAACLVSFRLANRNPEEYIYDQKFIKEYMSKIQKNFPEIIFTEDGKLQGIIDGKLNMIKINERFIRRISDLIPVYEKYGYKLIAKEKDYDAKKMTLAEFLDDCTKYYAKVLMRVKGLGELNYDELRDTAMDFNHRVSVQYTLDGAREELDEIFNIISSKKSKYIDLRKKMMDEYKVKREDLDN